MNSVNGDINQPEQVAGFDMNKMQMPDMTYMMSGNFRIMATMFALFPLILPYVRFSEDQTPSHAQEREEMHAAHQERMSDEILKYYEKSDGKLKCKTPDGSWVYRETAKLRVDESVRKIERASALRRILPQESIFDDEDIAPKAQPVEGEDSHEQEMEVRRAIIVPESSGWEK
ncbi:MAG: hypothetical protein COV36_00060 [Alphaproteobacteria bacterium CG11_big_fil_rev_8_21_14_0_20_44_7]|nr:MAG: hypothetical protein COV36_00060 [Alphaproteobacteria bacterium CG11_big_fil_rev_8_21_14_0_20_44_7]